MDIHSLFLSPDNYDALLRTVELKYREMTGLTTLPPAYRTLGLRLLKDVLRNAPPFRPGQQHPTDYLKQLNRRVLEQFMRSLASEVRGTGGAQQALQRDQTLPPRKVASFESALQPARGMYVRKADSVSELERRMEENRQGRAPPQMGGAVPRELRAEQVGAEDVDSILQRLQEETAERSLLLQNPSGPEAAVDETLESWEEAFRAVRAQEAEPLVPAPPLPAPIAAPPLFRPEDVQALEQFQRCLDGLRTLQVQAAPVAASGSSQPREVYVLESTLRSPVDSPNAWDLAFQFPPSWRRARLVAGWIPKTPQLHNLALVRVDFGEGSGTVVCELVCAADAAFPYYRVQPLQQVPAVDVHRDHRGRIVVKTVEGDPLVPMQDVFEIEALARSATEPDQWIVRTSSRVPADLLNRTTTIRIWGHHGEPSLPVHGSVPVLRTQMPNEFVVSLQTSAETSYDIKRAGTLILGNRPVQWLFEKIDDPGLVAA